MRCTEMIARSTSQTAKQGDATDQWGARHAAAMANPQPGTHEEAMSLLINGLALYADAYRDRYEIPITEDAVLAPHWMAVGDGVGGLLDGPLNRLNAHVLGSLMDEITGKKAVW